MEDDDEMEAEVELSVGDRFVEITSIVMGLALGCCERICKIVQIVRLFGGHGLPVGSRPIGSPIPLLEPLSWL